MTDHEQSEQLAAAETQPAFSTSPSLPSTTLALVLIAIACLLAFWVKVVDADVFWHLKTGELISQNKNVPATDPFSATARGQEWIAQEWLWDVVAFQVHKYLGWFGLSFARLISLMSALLFCALAARHRGASWLAAMISILIVLGSFMAFADIRPQSSTFALFGLCLYLLTMARQQPKILLIVPLLVLLWANLHGAFLIYFILAATFAGGWLLESLLAKMPDRNKTRTHTAVRQRLRDSALMRPLAYLVSTTLAALLFSLFNPNGYKLLTYPLRVVGETAIRQGIAEWLPPEATLSFVPFYVCLTICCVLFIVFRKALNLTDWCALLVFTAMAFLARRQIAFFALTMLPPLAVCVDSVLKSFTAGRSRMFRISLELTAVMAANALFLGAVSCQKHTRGEFGFGVQPGRFPERAADVLGAMQSGGTLLNDYNDGGYLIWRLWPRWNVFIDGRADIYGEKIVTQYKQIWQGPPREASALLDRHGVDAIIGRYDVTRQSPQRHLYHLLGNSGDNWSLVQWDDTAMLYLRKSIALQAPDAKPYRRIHPALSFTELGALQKSSFDWEALAADTRRAITEDPDSKRAAWWLQKVERVRKSASPLCG